MKQLLQLLTVFLMTSVAIAADTEKQSIFQIREVLDQPSADSEQMTYQHQKNKETGQTIQETLNVQKMVLLDQSSVKSAEMSTNQFGNPLIFVELTDEGQKHFTEVTRQNIGNRLAIVINGQVATAPRIMMEIPTRIIQIDGNFTESEAKDLAKKISDSVVK